MSPIGVFLFIVIVAGVSLMGWGWIATKIAPMPALPLPLVATLGMAALIFLGGILNLARLALPHSFDGLVLVGFSACCIFAFTSRSSLRPTWQWRHAITGAAVAGVGFIVMRHLTPQSTYNWNDDFERYFSYPVRMLQTGTLGGNPLGYVGVDTLGGQAFLQAFVVRYLPIEFIGSLETAVCLLLCLTLAGCASANWRGAILVGVAQLVVLCIDPQIVNVSSVYSTSALVMAACLLGQRTCERSAGTAGLSLLGLVYAGLVALKSTNLVFVVIHLGTLLAIELLTGPKAKPSLAKYGRLAALTLLFLLPWLAVHYATYAAAIGAKVTVPSTSFAREPLSLFSTAIPFFGVPQFYFTLVVLGGVALALLRCFLNNKLPRSASPRALSGIAAGFSGAACYIVFLVVLAPLIYGQEASTRYCCPILIGIIPASIVLVGDEELKFPFGLSAAAAALVGIGIIALFLPSSRKRLQQVVDHGSLLAFTSLANSPVYLAHNREVLHGATQETHRKIQALVPPAEPIVVWTLAPFWLNFTRNPIYNTSQHGLGMPRKTFPQARYFAWQYKSPAHLGRDRYRELLGASGVSDRVSAARTLEFIDELERYARTSDILFNDGEYALIRIRE
jgi:hypothetical protein